MNNKLLLGLFALLLIVFGATKLFKQKPQRSFERDIIQLESEKIDKIIVRSKAIEELPFTLSKSGDNWAVSDGTVDAPALTSKVNTLLQSINDIRATRVVAKSKDRWADYEVEDENAQRIELFSGGELKDYLVLGRFDFNQETRSAKTFVRRTNDVNIYSVDGFLGMSLGGKMNSYRDNTVTRLDLNSITEISLMASDGNALNMRKENAWVNQDNQPLDSARVEVFLNKIGNVNGVNFVDDFDATSAIKANTLKIQQDTEPIELIVTCYTTENPHQFIINSSINPSSYFSSDTAGIYKTLFTELPL